MKIAILYICTGKYECFWDEFYSSAKNKFLINYEKHFFVFTDNKSLINSKLQDVSFIYQEKIGWPFDTLYRYQFFSRIKNNLKEFDYSYYINANAIIVAEIGEEIFPDPHSFIGSQHPCYFDKKSEEFIYERNPKSIAHIPFGNGEHYVMGAFIGGKTGPFLRMCEKLNEQIQVDLQKDIIAIWHDESHYNHFLQSNSYKLLSPSYVYPEEMTLPFEPKIILRDKAKFGGHNSLRGIYENSIISKLRNRIKYLFNW